MTATRTASPLIGTCRNSHVVRGEVRMGEWVATTEGASVKNNCWLICGCGAAAFAKFMTVTVKEGKVCNSVCMGATGPSCSCSCGGENHGSGMVFS
jgi:hypothetical protein